MQAETDVRIAQIQQQLRDRDAEINRLQKELRVRNQNNGICTWVLNNDNYVLLTPDIISVAPFSCTQDQTTSREESVAAVQSPPQKSVAAVQSSPQKSVAVVQSSPQKSVAAVQSSPQKSVAVVQSSPQKPQVS